MTDAHNRLKTIFKHSVRTWAEYRRAFTPSQRRRHRQMWEQVGQGKFVVDVSEIDSGTSDGKTRVSCTIICEDHSGLFATASGVLSSSRFNISKVAGFLFELPAMSTAESTTHAVEPAKSIVVDYFEGTLDANLTSEVLADRLHHGLTVLYSDDLQALERFQQEIFDKVAEKIAESSSLHDPFQLPPWPIRCWPTTVRSGSEDRPRNVRISIRTKRHPDFYFAIGTALSLSKLSIQHIGIAKTSRDEIVHDLELIDEEGLKDPNRILEEVETIVTLLCQFLLTIARAPDPLAATRHFSLLARKVADLDNPGRAREILSHPTAMQSVARLLGMSEYLWNEFILGDVRSLLEKLEQAIAGRRFCSSVEQIPKRLDDCVAHISSNELTTFGDAVRKFAKHEIFETVIDHLLIPGSDYRRLGMRLTFLAETLLARACQFAWNICVDAYGEPVTRDGEPIRYAVFALGKFGGLALGYASDLEVMFLYSAEGETTVKKKSAKEFFHKMSRDVRTKLMHSTENGLFKIDEHLMPSSDFSPMVFGDGLKGYYASEDCDIIRRMSLTRLRWIAGDTGLGAEVERWRDEFLYHTWRPKLADLAKHQDFTEKQHVGGKAPTTTTVNAKRLLRRLESSIQWLQISFGSESTELRSPRMRLSIEALQRTGRLNATQFSETLRSYAFLRKLLNALRVLHGVADAVELPPEDSPKYRHLAYRMARPENWQQIRQATKVLSQDCKACEKTIGDLEQYVRDVADRHWPK